MARLAAIDAGSTSVHLLVADAPEASADPLRPVLDESTFAGLGEAIARDGRLGPATAAALAGVLGAYRARAGEAGAAGVVVLGTAPFRHAADAARVVRHVADATGLPLHVLTSREEALLTLVGATDGRRSAGDVAVVDVGGGSTEVVLAGAGVAPVVTGLPLGAASLAGRHVTGDPPLPDELAAMRAEARAAVRRLPAGPSRPTPATVLAVGGTADNLARLAGARTLPREVIEAVVERLAAMPAAEAAAAFGIRPARARLLPAGGAIVLALLEHWGAERIAVSAGMREGAILATAAAGPAWRDRLSELAGGWRDGPVR